MLRMQVIKKVLAFVYTGRISETQMQRTSKLRNKIQGYNIFLDNICETFTVTGTLHGLSFACTCSPLTNRRAVSNVDNLQAAL